MKEEILENISDHTHCPVRLIIDRMSDKWSVLILIHLGKENVMRFSEISQAISDISQKMLTNTLRSLEADGLLSRKYYSEIPPRVEYTLTELGRSLLPIIESMTDWANEHFDLIMQNRIDYDEKHSKKSC